MDKKSKKNLIIRVVVYSTLIIAAVFLIRFSIKTQPQEAHIVGMKLRGVEYCETPQEAIQRYAEALIKGDRDEALIYISLNMIQIFGTHTKEDFIKIIQMKN